ncbi:MAG: hypothetical protein WCI50_08545 [Actinomycetes bacterium]
MPDDAPRLGHAILAMHDPHPGFERAFNRWYEDDHMLGAGSMAPWTIAVARYVATKDCKDLRYPAEGPFGPASRGSYLALYWIQDGHLEDQQAWVTEQMVVIGEQGRMFEHRDAVTATTYDLARTVARAADGVPPVLALHRNYPGAVLVVLERSPETSLDALTDWFCDDWMAPRLAGSTVDQAIVFAPRPKEPWWPAAYPEVAGVGDRRFAVCFTTGDPRDAWDTHFRGLGQAAEAAGVGNVMLAAPFLACVIGTETHAERLWDD